MLAFGADGRLRHRWWDGTRWVEWEIVPDAPAGDAVTCTWSGDRLDVFVATRGGALWYKVLS